jgi:hypothetical protein
VATAVIAAFSFVLGAWGFVGFWVGSAALLVSLLSLAQGFVAGIGVGADVVLVRRASGRSRWVPWAEVQRFDLRERVKQSRTHLSDRRRPEGRDPADRGRVDQRAACPEVEISGRS